MPTTVVLSIWLSLTGVYSAGVNDGTAASPALVVQGLGHLSMPITPEQSSQLKALCSPDPGHLKDATDDPDKCPAWQLAPSQFECSNPGQMSGHTAGSHPSPFAYTCCCLQCSKHKVVRHCGAAVVVWLPIALFVCMSCDVYNFMPSSSLLSIQFASPSAAESFSAYLTLDCRLGSMYEDTSWQTAEENGHTS